MQEQFPGIKRATELFEVTAVAYKSTLNPGGVGNEFELYRMGNCTLPVKGQSASWSCMPDELEANNLLHNTLIIHDSFNRQWISTGFYVGVCPREGKEAEVSKSRSFESFASVNAGQVFSCKLRSPSFMLHAGPGGVEAAEKFCGE